MKRNQIKEFHTQTVASPDGRDAAQRAGGFLAGDDERQLQVSKQPLGQKLAVLERLIEELFQPQP